MLVNSYSWALERKGEDEGEGESKGRVEVHDEGEEGRAGDGEQK